MTTIAEPAWHLLFSDPENIATATEHWRVITIELRDRDLLAEANANSVERLVIAYLIYGSAARIVAQEGAVIPPSPTNTRAIARISPHWRAMCEASSEATALEAELGLAPRRRAAATKVERRRRAARAADSYLRPLDGGKAGPG